MTADVDLVVTNGHVIDGSGRPAFEGDVAVRDGRIVSVGKAEGTAARRIDANGHVVAPGFVDIHTHYDVQLFWDRMLSVSPWHGVTTVVAANCGFGIAPARPEHREILLRTLEQVEGMPYETTSAGIGAEWPFVSFPEYLDAVEERGTAINAGFLVGHTPVRLYAMGEAALDRAATADEVEVMTQVVGEAMEAGALGFSTSNHRAHTGYLGRPVPSRKATLEEIIALVQAMRSTGKGVFATNHGPVMSNRGMRAVMDATGTRINWSGIFSGEGPEQGGPYAHREFVGWLDELCGEGYDLVAQVSPRPFVIQVGMERPFMFAHDAPEVLHIEVLDELFDRVSEMSHAEKVAYYRSPGFEERFVELTSTPGWTDQWSRTSLADVPGRPELADQPITKVAAEWGVHPSTVLLRSALDTDLEAKVSIAYLNGDEDEVSKLLLDPRTRLGLGDAGAHVGEICDAAYPTHLLGHWVRERQLTSVEHAVHMLTARSAEVCGLGDRGQLQPGFAGDIVVFDPDTVRAGERRRQNDLPAGASRVVVDGFGIDHVIVNGTPIIEAGEAVVDPTGALPGRLLRS